MKVIWCMIPETWSAPDRIFLSSWAIFCLFTAITAQETEIKKNKKTTGDIILHNCTKNHDHMLHCSWDMPLDGCNCYFSFLAILYPFIPLAAQKLTVSKKMKKMPGDIIIFHMCTKNYD